MHTQLRDVLRLTILLGAAGTPAWAQAPAPDFAAISASENAANAQPGPRTTPGKVIPVPDDVSPAMQTVIANGFRAGFWDVNPKSADEWRQFVAHWASVSIQPLAAIRDKLGVTMQETTVDGVHVYILQPKVIPAVNANRLLVHVHGGGYTNSPGEAATSEAALMAGVRRLQGDLRRLPHAARRSVSGSAGRCDDGISRRAQDAEGQQHRRVRPVHRRRTDAGDDAARPRGGVADARRDRPRNTLGRSDGDRRFLPHQRVRRQRAGCLSRLAGTRRGAVRQWA